VPTILFSPGTPGETTAIAGRGVRSSACADANDKPMRRRTKVRKKNRVMRPLPWLGERRGGNGKLHYNGVMFALPD
jgi:hypothetical protein